MELGGVGWSSVDLGGVRWSSVGIGWDGGRGSGAAEVDHSLVHGVIASRWGRVGWNGGRRRGRG